MTRKRALDLALLLPLVPLFAAVTGLLALAVLLADGGPAFFHQPRAAAQLRRLVRGSEGHEQRAIATSGGLLALAYPDRVAQRRLEREGRYLLAQGSGVALPPGDPLASHPYLVAAGLDAAGRDGRIQLALPITEPTKTTTGTSLDPRGSKPPSRLRSPTPMVAPAASCHRFRTAFVCRPSPAKRVAESERAAIPGLSESEQRWVLGHRHQALTAGTVRARVILEISRSTLGCFPEASPHRVESNATTKCWPCQAQKGCQGESDRSSLRRAA